jgi:hypothetical protein
MGLKKNVFTLKYSPYDFVVLTYLIHPRNIILFVLQIRKIGKNQRLIITNPTYIEF